MRETLAGLHARGLTLGLVTSKVEWAARESYERYGLGEFLSVARVPRRHRASQARPASRCCSPPAKGGLDVGQGGLRGRQHPRHGGRAGSGNADDRRRCGGRPSGRSCAGRRRRTRRPARRPADDHRVRSVRCHRSTAAAATLSADEVRPLQPAPHPARGRHRRAASAQGRAACCCIGAGGLGSPVAMYLAAAGVGTHRHRRLRRRRLQQPAAADPARHPRRRPAEARVGAGAAEGASTRTSRVETYETRCPRRTRSSSFAATTSSSTAPTTSRRATWSTTPACCSASRTSTAASSASRARRRCSRRQDGPCYRCLYPEPPPPGLVPSCAEGGVLGVLPGVIGTIQATEAIKLDPRAGEPLVGRLPDLRRAAR